MSGIEKLKTDAGNSLTRINDQLNRLRDEKKNFDGTANAAAALEREIQIESANANRAFERYWRLSKLS